MFEHEAETLRRVMANPKVRLIYSRHAREERMPERRICDADVREVLKKCRVTEVRPNDKGDRDIWNAEGRDLDERLLRICVTVNDLDVVIVVITMIDMESS